MVTVVRLLFGVCALVFFFVVATVIGRRAAFRMGEQPQPSHLYFVAFLVNTVLLVVFFTLWCVRVGVV